ncbi:MAG: hypothetical protein HYZ90_02570 [Candidatus Omnitrophica bacterium]|nr:hypothetical protein [Candidatus Omnitrophota bacterium]
MRRPVILISLGLIALWAGWHWKAPSSLRSAQGFPPPILVDDFETGETQGLFAQRKNRLDAFQGTWARRPSYTVITKVADTRPGSSGKALRIEYQKLGGWCGWYTLLNGINASKLNALTFWVRGEKGGERFDIGLADNRMQDLEIDAVYAGPITAFLPQGVATHWQQVKVPLAGLRSDIDLTRLGSLVLWFRYEGKGAIEIDDVAFIYDQEVEEIQKANAPRAKPDPRAARFSWVWKYDPVNNPQIREELLSFCGQTAIGTVFVYLGEDPITRMPKEYQKNLAEFLQAAHSKGVHVEALQGNPLWALKEHHPQVFDWVGGYLEFNRERPQEERIDGVSLDIEPYLTSDWESGDREKLKSEFVELVAQLRKMIDGEKQGHPFILGLAVPVFYNREPVFEEALLKEVDYFALMDYYDTAIDIADNARFHIDLANRLGKKVVVGVETQDLVQMGQGKRRNTFHEEGWLEMERQLSQVVDLFAKELSFGGVAIHAYDSYRLLQKGRNVPTRERSGKVPALKALRAPPGVALDGEIGEWAGAPWYTVNQRTQVVYGAGAWAGAHDLSCKIAAGWDEEALYLALDVTDNALVQEKRGAEMWEGDHAELWLDMDLDGDYSEAVNSSDDFQLGLSPGDFGQLKPEVFVWVPSVDPKSLAQVQIAARKQPFGYTLEVRLPAKFLFQTLGKRVGVEPKDPQGTRRQVIPAVEGILQSQVLSSQRFQAGFRMGLMLDGSDSDEARQPQKCLISTSGERQWGDPTTFNILELE